MSVGSFVLIALGIVTIFALAWRHRQRKAARFLNDFKSAAEDQSPMAGIPAAAAKRLMAADFHYQLRVLVDDFPRMRSPKYLDYVEAYWSQVSDRPEFNPYMIYKARWIRNCYPGPSLQTCKSYEQIGSMPPGCFVSIESGLDRAAPKQLRHPWACEASGAFLQADTLEAMRVVAMNYPILLRPAVQGGIDSQIERLSDPDRSACQEKLRLLQRLREEIEGHQVKSWWRPGGDPDPVSGRRSW